MGVWLVVQATLKFWIELRPEPIKGSQLSDLVMVWAELESPGDLPNSRNSQFLGENSHSVMSFLPRRLKRKKNLKIHQELMKH